VPLDAELEILRLAAGDRKGRIANGASRQRGRRRYGGEEAALDARVGQLGDPPAPSSSVIQTRVSIRWTPSTSSTTSGGASVSGAAIACQAAAGNSSPTSTLALLSACGPSPASNAVPYEGSQASMSILMSPPCRAAARLNRRLPSAPRTNFVGALEALRQSRRRTARCITTNSQPSPRLKVKERVW
jgi:hypothetical protein